jgi:TM2 domain-containing membrane protein YozV
MPHPIIGLLFTGLIIRTVLAVVIIGALVWLIFKLGKLADAYTEKLRAK